MAKVVDVHTKSADVQVTDARGRTLTLRKPNVLAQYQLVRMLGADASSNQTYLSMVMPLLYLQSIDGEVVNFSNQRELDAAIQKLDEEGLEALAKGIQQNFVRQEDAGEAIKKP
jgi:hypothetical protein